LIFHIQFSHYRISKPEIAIFTPIQPLLATSKYIYG